MKLKKLLAYGIGVLCATGILCGALILLFRTPMSISSGVVIICLSLCFGMLMPNPVSFWSLIAGACMIVFPAPVTGIILLVLSAGGALANLLVFKRLAQR